MYKKIGFFSLIFCAIQVFATPWLTDLDQALVQAQNEQKDILVAFLGPDWCSASDQLEEQVLSEASFTTPLSETILLVRVNIPENCEQKEKWQERFQVTKCPSLVLLRFSGEPIAHIDALSKKATDSAQHILHILSDFHQVEEFALKKNLKKCKAADLKVLYSKAQKLADSRFKKTFLEEGVKADRGPYFLLEQYGQLLASQKEDKILLRRIRNKIAARDPQNAQGYQREVALLDFEALAKDQKVKKVSSVVKPLIDYLEKFGRQDTKHAWQLEMKISQYYFSHDDNDQALKHARASLSLAPQEAKDEVTQSIEYLKTHIQ